MAKRRAKKKAKKRKKKAKKVARPLYVKSMVKREVGKMRVSSDLWPTLNRVMKALLADAVRRAKGNKRKTVRAADL